MHDLLLLALGLSVQSPPTAGDSRLDYAVVVHGENRVQSLSEAELRRLLKAETQFWPRGGQVVDLLLPSSGTGAKKFLQQRIYGMTDLQLKRYWLELIYQNRIVEAPRSVPSSQVAVPMLERLRGALTVFPASEVIPPANIKIVALDDKLPGDRGYPLSATEALQAEARIPDAGARAGVTEASAPRARTPVSDAEAPSTPRTLEEWDGDGWPPLNLRVFAHGEFEWEKETEAGVDTTTNGFSIEVIDLLMTSALTERMSVLAETTFEAQEQGGFVLEVERLLLKYRHSDAFSVSAGRFLTGIGYWNTRYHHGEWLQTSIDRPEVLDFEDDTGLLPTHNVGLSFKGAFCTDALLADYTVEVANGRGPTADNPQVELDANDGKAVNVAIGLEPAFLHGLRLGGGIYVDEIPENTDPTIGNVHDSIDEQITNVFCAFNDIRWEMMGEYFWVDQEEAGVSADSTGWYVQVGRHFGYWTPYVRVDGIDRSDLNTYFDTADDGFTYALGVRRDLGKHVALTLQYEHAEFDAPPGDDNSETDTIVLQASVVF
ncbi:MAG: outer membrane beta-barrel protein [Planctomycetota bacterium]